MNTVNSLNFEDLEDWSMDIDLIPNTKCANNHQQCEESTSSRAVLSEHLEDVNPPVEQLSSQQCEAPSSPQQDLDEYLKDENRYVESSNQLLVGESIENWYVTKSYDIQYGLQMEFISQVQLDHEYNILALPYRKIHHLKKGIYDVHSITVKSNRCPVMVVNIDCRLYRVFTDDFLKTQILNSSDVQYNLQSSTPLFKLYVYKFGRKHRPIPYQLFSINY